MKMLNQTFQHLDLFSKPELYLALSIIVVLYCLTLAKRSNLPVCWPLFGMFPSFLIALKTGIHEVVTDILQNHNGTFTFKGPWFSKYDHVVTSDPCNIEHILKKNISNFGKGESLQTVAQDFLGDSLFSRDGEKWHWLRKIYNVKLHLVDFNKMARESWVELVDSRLLPVLEDFAKQSVSFDLHDVLSRLALDQACITAFGVDPGYLNHGLPMVPFAKAFKIAEELTVMRFSFPIFIWKVMKYLNLGPERELKKSIEEINEFAHKVITTRKMEVSKNPSDRRSDFLSLLMESKDENQKCFPDNFLRDNCFNLMFAGADTIPVALSWFFWLLHKNPIVEEQIYAEVCHIVGNEEEDSGAIFRPEEVKKMNYLQAALTEALRLYPPAPINRMEVHNDDEFPNGFKLKKGILVIFSAYAMGRTENLWGKDCREFKPERWLTDGEFVAESSYKFAVFNAGLRTCLAKDLSYYMMKVVAASIIQRYRLNVVENHPVVPRLSLMLHMKYGLKVYLTRRY